MIFLRHTIFFLLWLFFAIAENTFSQNLLVLNGNEKKTRETKHPKNRDYSQVDAYIHSLSETKFSKMEKLSEHIKSNFSDEAEKVRAIFIWITDNISYDCEQYHHPSRPEKLNAKNKKEYTAEIDESNRKDAEECFVKRKGVCHDYAQLFKYLCEYAGVESKVVGGYANSAYVENLYLGSHAWNKVKIEGEWYFIDATWASGYADKRVKKFTKEFNELYFLSSPESVAKTHFEKKEKNNSSGGWGKMYFQFGRKSCSFPWPF